ncbi:MAG: hypothetical protein J5911_00285 [Clostridia bacterium]|nr:hypothetical protein [Clostridia bacterium]
MTEYYTEADLSAARKQRKRTLVFFYIVLGLFVATSVALFVYYRTLPYESYGDTASKIALLKGIHYSLTALFVVFAFIYLGIKFKRVNRYYKLCRNMSSGLREQYTGSFFEYDDKLQDKDGVDFKALVFIEWNKYKKDFFERKVLVFYEKPFPEIPLKANVSYITQGNVLVSYEILS